MVPVAPGVEHEPMPMETPDVQREYAELEVAGFPARPEMIDAVVLAIGISEHFWLAHYYLTVQKRRGAMMEIWAIGLQTKVVFELEVDVKLETVAFAVERVVFEGDVAAAGAAGAAGVAVGAAACAAAAAAAGIDG